MISRSSIQNNPIAYSYSEQSITSAKPVFRNPITQADVEIKQVAVSKKIERNPIVQGEGGNIEGNGGRGKKIERNPLLGEEIMSVKGIVTIFFKKQLKFFFFFI